MYGSMIMALVLGIYGQSITYYINENIIEVSLVYCLTALTITSILLFVIPPILAYKLNKKRQIEKKELDIYCGLNLIIGIFISIWSLFVLIMWWG
jgi:membrane protein YdbS with pleckstrin-like domain